jgi:hypothetical protein
LSKRERIVSSLGRIRNWFEKNCNASNSTTLVRLRDFTNIKVQFDNVQTEIEAINKEAIDFINVIGNRLIAESGDSKSKKFLFERISLAIQRGNAASIRGTFPDSAILSEIFVL